MGIIIDRWRGFVLIQNLEINALGFMYLLFCPSVNVGGVPLSQGVDGNSWKDN